MDDLQNNAFSGHLEDTEYSFFLNGVKPEQDGLAKLALQDLRDRSGLSGETLKQAQVRIFSGNRERLKEHLGFSSFNGQSILALARPVEIPSFSLDGKISEYHFRLYPPIEGTRYLHPKGKPARPYILPSVWAVREKVNRPLWITEGAKKVLKLIQHGRPAIGLKGVWNHRGAGEGDESFLFKEFDAFLLKGRTLILGFDEDSRDNPQVRSALFELALKLMSRGGIVHFPRWTGAKGIDDYLVTCSIPEEALRSLEANALPFDKFISLDHIDALLRALKKTHTAFDGLNRGSLVRTIAKKLNIRADRLFAELGHGRHLHPTLSGAELDQPKENAPDLPYGFHLKSDGLYFNKEIKEGEISPVKICSPLEVLALTRDPEGRDWGRLLRFKDPDGRLKKWAMPTSLLSGDGTQLRAELLSMGLLLQPGRETRELLERYLMQSHPSARVRCVSKIGWLNNCYVLPDTAYGSSAGEVVYQGNPTAEHQFQISGTAEDWRENIGRLCVGNSRLVLAVSTALAGVLLYPMGEESGGLHFRGGSSIGKTTALYVAASIWGPPEAYINQWRATANGLEAAAQLRNDGLLCLDELSQLPAREASETAFLLANGQAKARMGKNILVRRAARWRLLFLSTGELGLADKISEEGMGRRTTAGQEVRIIDIPADAGIGFGLFEGLHGNADAADLARHLKRQAGQHYGAAGRAFLEKVTGDINGLRRQVETACQKWMKVFCSPRSSGQVKRGAGRFALIAAAGELASSMGLTGWPQGEAAQAAGECFSAWLESRGTAGALEPETALAQVRRFLEAHGESRFAPMDVDEPNRPTINRAGFRRNTRTGIEFYILPEAWREICQGLDPRFTAQVLTDRGHLLPGGEGRVTYKCRLPGLGFVRVYRLRSSILDEQNKFEDSPKKGGNNWEQWEYQIKSSSLAISNPKGEMGTLGKVGTEEKCHRLMRSQCSQAEKGNGNRENRENPMITELFPVFPLFPAKNNDSEKNKENAASDCPQQRANDDDEP